MRKISLATQNKIVAENHNRIVRAYLERYGYVSLELYEMTEILAKKLNNCGVNAEIIDFQVAFA